MRRVSGIRRRGRRRQLIVYRLLVVLTNRHEESEQAGKDDGSAETETHLRLMPAHKALIRQRLRALAHLKRQRQLTLLPRRSRGTRKNDNTLVRTRRAHAAAAAAHEAHNDKYDGGHGE